MSILEATHRAPECSEVGVHAGMTAEEAEAAGTSTANRTAPIETEGTNIEE